jgi:glycosyltransferase involved in cell wall biosynthesis/predicted  nucleic acid-binding Zn-ribbon protein
MHKLKVLYISHSAGIYGAEVCLLTLLSLLDKTIFEPVVVLPADGPLREKIESLGIRTYISPLERWVEQEAVFRFTGKEILCRIQDLAEIIDKETPDILHTNTSVIYEGALASAMKGIPHVWHIHETLTDHPSFKPILPVPLFYNVIDDLSEKVVVVSKAAKQELSRFISAGKVVTIYNGIDENRFKQISGQSIREELSLPDDAVLAVTVASLSKYKGHDTLLDAASLVKKKGHKIVFILVGPGSPDAVDKLFKKIRDLDLGDMIQYLGFREDIPRVVGGSDLFVLPSIREAFPLVILEAMALHKPVVATNCSGPEEMLIDGESGFLVPVNDSESLAEKILLITSDKEKMAEMGEKAYIRFKENFTAKAYAGRFEDLYKSLKGATKARTFLDEEKSLFNSILEAYQNFIGKMRKVSEQDILLSERDRRIAALDNRLAGYEHQVLSFKKQITQHNQHLIERDRQLTERDRQLTERDQQLAHRDRQLAHRDRQLTERDQQLAQREKQLVQSNQRLGELNKQLNSQRQELARLHQRIIVIEKQAAERAARIDGLLNSLSWKITVPLRKTYDFLHGDFKIARNIMEVIKFYNFKQAIPNIRAYGLGTFLRNARREIFGEPSKSSPARHAAPSAKSRRQAVVEKKKTGVNQGSHFQHPHNNKEKNKGKEDGSSLASNRPEPDTRLIAFYLPQFHPIPENDEWWEKGFTEWTNVAKAKPLFPGHEQPIFPGDLGYYDLRLPEVREAQAELAKAYGIEGFCYWHYWFGGGKRLLERPFNEVVKSGRPDFPFCLSWANHTWSGIWHGCPDRILIEQTYPGIEDFTAHFYAMLEAFRDSRYMKVDGRNIFCVYRPYDLEGAKLFMDTWRGLAEKEGIPGFYFIAITDYPWKKPEDGYDAFTTNPPVGMLTHQGIKSLNEEIERIYHNEQPKLPRIYSYEAFVRNAFPKRTRQLEFYPCIVPNWDNTPRSGVNGFVLHGSTPELFAEHLREAAGLVADRDQDRRVVFIKSWNEWAETNYLEPDLKWGKEYLEKTLETVTATARKI